MIQLVNWDTSAWKITGHMNLEQVMSLQEPRCLYFMQHK